ncbi:MAG: patatin-like phospholipase family protein [Chitinophagales bacterium]|nr:patatin-like phospholipase family protein [Chitinophagales bacterium]
MKKLFLVLSGGGAKGAFQVGALKYIFENGLHLDDEYIPGDQVRFDYIAGISAGSLNALMVAMGEFDQLFELWTKTVAGKPKEIWTSDFVTPDLRINKAGIIKRLLPKINLGRMLGLIFSKEKALNKLVNAFTSSFSEIKALASNAPLKEKLDRLADLRKIKDTILRVGYVSLETGKYHSFRHTEFNGNNEEFKKAILASTAMPIIWPPVDSIEVHKNGEIHKHLVDGGLRNISPLGDIIKDINGDIDSNTEYYVIIINNQNEHITKSDEEKSNILNIALRSLMDITLNEIFINDIKEFTRINHIIHQMDDYKSTYHLPASLNFKTPKGRPLRKFHHHIIQPSKNMEIGNTLDFSKEKIEERIAFGFQKAKEVLKESPSRGWNSIWAQNDS